MLNGERNSGSLGTKPAVRLAALSMRGMPAQRHSLRGKCVNSKLGAAQQFPTTVSRKHSANGNVKAKAVQIMRKTPKLSMTACVMGGICCAADRTDTSELLGQLHFDDFVSAEEAPLGPMSGKGRCR
jgi:hypothetical protein